MQKVKGGRIEKTHFADCLVGTSFDRATAFVAGVFDNVSGTAGKWTSLR
jgi:hypothetical protein